MISQTLPDIDADFGDLDSLLAEATQQVRDAADAKAARERQKKGGQSAAEKAADAERLARWEAAHEWQAVANVALFHRYTCACGAHSTVFEQLMSKQKHRHLRDSIRYQLTKTTNAALPNATVIRRSDVLTCPRCALGKGWDLAKSTEWAA